jgi:hypothetical protein
MLPIYINKFFLIRRDLRKLDVKNLSIKSKLTRQLNTQQPSPDTLKGHGQEIRFFVILFSDQTELQHNVLEYDTRGSMNKI